MRSVTCIASIHCSIIAILLVATTVSSDDATPIPPDVAQVNKWFQDNVKPLADRKGTLDPALEAAEANPKTIKVRQDGSGEFKTLTDAIKSIPTGNTQRVIIDIGSGTYTEKLKIEREKKFVTFKGSAQDMPILVFGGTAKEYGTVYSATLEAEADYFVASNIVFKNSAPRPSGDLKGGQALALRIGGDKSAFYNCKFHGFQDTLCDDKGRHFFKDCYIEGTVDFIFGSGQSIYLGTELHVLADGQMAFITAHARNTPDETGFSFVHGKVTGVGKGGFLGRAWTERPRVIFAYSDINDVIDPQGWSINMRPEREKTVEFLEYQCKGPGAQPSSRAKFTKQMAPDQVNRYTSLGFIAGSSWLLPPPS